MLVRAERGYLLFRPLRIGTVMLIARPNANLNTINVGFRVLELKLARIEEGGELTPSPSYRTAYSALDRVLGDPLIEELQALFHASLGSSSRVLFKNRVRLLVSTLAEPIAEAAYRRLVDDLSRFLRTVGERELFASRAENMYLTYLNRQLAAEREELGRLVATFEQGVKLCNRIAEPTRGTAPSEDELVTSEVIDFCANNDRALSSAGPTFRDGFLALTNQLLATRRELSESGRVQRMLLPDSSELEYDCARLAAYFAPAAQCGGDWWTSKQLPDQRLVVTVGDVTGHSLSAAIITGVAKAAFDVACMADGKVTCDRLLEFMNEAVYDATRAKVLMTCVVSIIDPRTRSMTVASAGHSFPYLVRNQQGTNHIQTLVSRGNPLGAKPKLEVESTTAALRAGDLIVWYSDGATECENEQSEPFGDRRFRRTVCDLAAHEPDVVRDHVIGSIDAFRGDALPNDDLTFVAGKVTRWPDASR
ncbi:MAG: hypothetical protein Tsb0020_18330 [Haliangiales bacterium]